MTLVLKVYITMKVAMNDDHDNVVTVANGDGDDDGDNFGQVASRGVDISDKGTLCPFHSQPESNTQDM